MAVLVKASRGYWGKRQCLPFSLRETKNRLLGDLFGKETVRRAVIF